MKSVQFMGNPRQQPSKHSTQIYSVLLSARQVDL